MPARTNTTKAEAFTFVLDQIGHACDDITPLYEDAPKVKDTEIWTCFFPMLSNNQSKCSKLKSQRDPSELVRIILGYDPQQVQGNPYGEMAAWLRDVIVDANSIMFEALASESVISKRFDRESIDTFLRLLHKDFGNSPTHLYNEFEAALDDLLLKVALANNQRSGDATPARVNSIVLLLLASLFGPRDYRPELRVDVLSKRAKTRPVRNNGANFAMPEDRGIELSAYLSRVTFTHNPPDERDWVICQMHPESVIDQTSKFETYSLDDKTEVLIARGFKRYEDEACVLRIPVNCELASSEGHLRLHMQDGSWVLEDLDSTNGTLVVRRDGDRFCLYKDADFPDGPITLQNGDVICIAPQWDTMHADPNCPAFVFHTATVDWA